MQRNRDASDLLPKEANNRLTQTHFRNCCSTKKKAITNSHFFYRQTISRKSGYSLSMFARQRHQRNRQIYENNIDILWQQQQRKQRHPDEKKQKQKQICNVSRNRTKQPKKKKKKKNRYIGFVRRCEIRSQDRIDDVASANRGHGAR
jgi:hypothetical protein